ncbi:hypothetical protein PR202_gb01987 [Eleusine coracana subsp. coracana]|uniref:Uncharacterized protein n=1 Tax=Eleusine coracana subsp. coracana TaxID=191504 RepID=A0AAV5DXC3_ELECO|nr:hypothetical protein PR202_gb01987 [Eleusine coracana subsp. coracana]
MRPCKREVQVDLPEPDEAAGRDDARGAASRGGARGAGEGDAGEAARGRVRGVVPRREPAGVDAGVVQPRVRQRGGLAGGGAARHRRRPRHGRRPQPPAVDRHYRRHGLQQRLRRAAGDPVAVPGHDKERVPRRRQRAQHRLPRQAPMIALHGAPVVKKKKKKKAACRDGVSISRT